MVHANLKKLDSKVNSIKQIGVFCVMYAAVTAVVGVLALYLGGGTQYCNSIEIL